MYQLLLKASLLVSVTLAVQFHPLKEKPGLLDNGTFGPEIEVVHLFRGDAPIGITISKTGRAFVTFNRGNLESSPATVVELTSSDTEIPFPSLEFNTPPAGLFNTTTGRTLGSSDSNHFINTQAVVIDSKDRLWVLDKGRPAISGDNILAAPGGPKLLGFNLGSGQAGGGSNNESESTGSQPFTTITFPESVLPPNGYINDVRFDLRSQLTKSGKGVAYISDSGGFGIIVVDLGTGQSWRHLDHLRSVSLTPRLLPTLFGIPTFLSSALNQALHYQNAGGGGGIDGIAISPDGKFLYYTPIASRDLYRVETSSLRVNPNEDKLAFIRAANSVQYLGEMGGQADGLESDSTGIIYISSPEHNSINTYNPETGLIEPFVRSPILAWADTLNVATDGYLYATVNQLWLSAGFQGGVDKRVPPFALVRVKIAGGRIEL